MTESGRRYFRYRLWHCLQTVCEMEQRLEQKGWADPFQVEFGFLRELMDRMDSMALAERDLARVERSIQALLDELGDLFETHHPRSQPCLWRPLQ